MSADRPVSVAIVNDYEVVVAGLAKILSQYPDRIRVSVTAVRSTPSDKVDVLLYDTFSQDLGILADVSRIREESSAEHVVVYSWNLSPRLVEGAFRMGASGYLDKRIGADELVRCVERVHAGERVVATAEADPQTPAGDWPGRNHGLTEREAEIVALITQGLSNDHIADRAYLSVNTVKSYIRNAYRKMGVSSRTQAVLWGIDHGFMQLNPERPAGERDESRF